jgi:hypothetical protein
MSKNDYVDASKPQERALNRRNVLLGGTTLAAASAITTTASIPVAPNIDRIAREGIKFLHYYREQSCTAGRAAFLTGQHGIKRVCTFSEAWPPP